MNDTCPAPTFSPDLDALRNDLRKVVDPEVGMNIVDLGLVYRIAPEEGRLVVDLTMTSPACPMGETIVAEVVETLRAQLPERIEPDVRLVWEPPWSPEMMSEQAREHFGW